MTTLLKTGPDVIYPETDGLPLSDNTKQLRLILTTKGGLDTLFQDKKVFVAGNLLWLPVEGSGESKAPDIMVIFGQDKGDRTSYKQWLEGNIGPQVAFEFVSLNNSTKEVEVDKLNFYQKHGIDEYYIHDPDKGTLKGWIREGTWFQPIEEMNGWVSPLMNIRFEMVGNDLQLYYPDGRPFETYSEVMRQRALAEQRAEQAEAQLERKDSQLEQKDSQLEQMRTQLEQLTGQLSNLSPEQLKALGIDPELLN